MAKRWAVFDVDGGRVRREAIVTASWFGGPGKVVCHLRLGGERLAGSSAAASDGCRSKD